MNMRKLWVKDFCFLILSCCFCSLFADENEDIAQHFEDIAPKKAPYEKETIIRPEEEMISIDRTKILAPELRALVFTDYSKKMISENINDLKGIYVLDMKIPEENKFKRDMEKYLGDPVTLGRIEEIRNDIVRFYNQHGISLVAVSVPPEQKISSGVLHFVIVDGKLGEIKVEGARYFDPRKIKEQISLKKGQTIDGQQLIDDIAWLNNNPFRFIEPLYEPGKGLSETDIILKVEDRLPFRLYAGYENTGNNVGGPSRWLSGFNWGNVFGLDHQANFQFMFAESISQWWGISASYLAPLPWKNLLKVFGCYVESEPEVEIGYFSHGRSWQVSSRYEVPISSGRFRNKVNLGYDFKRANNFLAYTIVQLYSKDTDISQFVFQYEAAYDDPWGTTAFGMELFGSPGKMTKYNTNSKFNAQRPGAKANYFYGKLSCDRITALPANFSWLFTLCGQFSSGKLLPSEEFALGGYATVRGYDEYEVISDEGILIKNEVRSPSLPLLTRQKGKKDELQILGFIDFGWAHHIDQTVLDKENTAIASFGPGIRYNLHDYVTLRLDYGWQLKNIIRNFELDNIHSRVHLSLVVGF